MVPYVAAASCSGSGRTPREVAWGLALAAGSRLIDAKVGNFWKKPTGGTIKNGLDGYGVSCTVACATPATGGCDASGLSEIVTEAGFKLAKPEAMSCPGGYSSYGAYHTPYKLANGACKFGPNGNCGASSTYARRLCACKCGAGSSQPLSAPQRGIVSCQT